MKKTVLVLFVMLLGSMATLQAQSVVGKWKTIDDATGKEKSIIEITEKDGEYFGKIIKLINPTVENPKCDKCPSPDKGKPILGLTIIKGLVKKGQEYTNGKILDPQSGKEYKCTIKLNGSNKLDVRGYVGISLMGRTQTWVRA
ncbi:DUF2147 domain-containing protein [Flavobacterium sp. JP2137]|uniref:DUF2147 domain-containing protein n=1 Tax=Flavobacterium sp. JP2137 TaxID=3414510 RepID=UPI003D2FDA89